MHANSNRSMSLAIRQRRPLRPSPTYRIAVCKHAGGFPLEAGPGVRIRRPGRQAGPAGLPLMRIARKGTRSPRVLPRIPNFSPAWWISSSAGLRLAVGPWNRRRSWRVPTWPKPL